MSAAEQIPAPLRYGASQSQARVVRNTIMPQGVSTGGPGSIVRFVLPERSIVDLRSLSLYYTYTISGMVNTGAEDFQMPKFQHHISTGNRFAFTSLAQPRVAATISIMTRYITHWYVPAVLKIGSIVD